MNHMTFKSIMGSFPSGVSVVTVTDLDGTPRGLTCSSACSVSLEPAMLLICVDKASNTLPVLEERGSFVINFLSEQSDDVARICASKAADKFSKLRWRTAEYADGAPILIDHITAYAECRIIEAVDAGDHIVLIARVLTGAAYPARQPMVYARGKIKQLAKSEAVAA